MNKTQIKEIIKDFEKISKVVNDRLEQLYALLGEERSATTSQQPKSQIKNAIEQQRQEMMRQVEEMRRQAMAQVQESINNSTQGVGGNMMPSMMGAPGNMPGMMGMPGGMVGKRPPMAPEETEKLREQIKSNLKIAKETEEDDNS